jgi:Zn-finger nucleic acid-binding protein
MPAPYNDEEVTEALWNLVGSPRDPNANDELVPSGQRSCPICGACMVVEKHAAISIDVCPAHGLWLDNGELPLLIRAARSRMTSRHLTAIRDAKEQGKLSGALLGFWSLLLP